MPRWKVSANYEVKAPDLASATTIARKRAAENLRLTKVVVPTTNYGMPAPPVGPFQVVDGGGTKVAGVEWRGEQARTFRKLHVRNHTGYNLLAMDWRNGSAQPAYPPVIVEDCVFENAVANPPKSMDGRGEANLWLGASSYARRFVCRHGGWMGLWTGGMTDTLPADSKGGCYASLIEDFLIEDQDIGVYVEHDTRYTTFRKFRINARETAVTVEWWYDNRGSYSNTFEDFYIEVSDPNGWGFFLDGGVFAHTIRNGIIKGGQGICLPKNVKPYTIDPTKPNVVENVRRPDGSPVPIVYHERPAG